MRRQGRGLGPGTIKGVAAGCAVAVAGGVATKGAKPADAATAEEQVISQQVLAFNNQERAARGLPPLALDAYAAGQAQDWAHRMRSGGRISHRPNLSSVFAAYLAYGENVGETAQGAGTLHRLWMGSAAHRRNQLQAGFDAAGVGVACAPDGRMWVAVDYVGRSSAVASRYTSSVAAPSPVVVGAPGLRCPQPVGAATVGTPGTGGYGRAASDGGGFALGDAGSWGPVGGRRLTPPLLGRAPSPPSRA